MTPEQIKAAADRAEERSASAAEKQRPGHLFRPGQSGNPAGRKKGSRNKLGEAFVQALQEDFETFGKDAIERVRSEKPHEYLKVIAGILPKEVKVDVGPLEEIGDDELAAILAAARAAVLAAPPPRGGDGEAGAGEPAGGVSTLQ